ncbi:location of vulva defective 1-like [Haliotis rubra]|uniref:location of vulva defective 1-like n=1 Tax=Haliotis rubra TaxID=36100 RepID=UPI001EE51C43|nr:location of vulva defective 1-like [Haliotis rubra]
MNRNLFLWLLCATAAICRGKQVSTFSEMPDSAGSHDDYSGYRTAANPDNCKEFCRAYDWCVAAEFDFNTYGCFLYNGVTQISRKKGSVFMKQRYTEVTTTQPTTTTATFSSTTAIPMTTDKSPSTFYTTLTTADAPTATTTTKGPSRTDERHTTGLLLPKSTFIEGKQVSTFSEMPDSAGSREDYDGYKTVANPDNCKEFCRAYGWCVAAEFDFNTYGCFLYNGDTQISRKKGSVFMKQQYTKVTTTQPATTTATSSSTTAVPMTTDKSPSTFYTTMADPSTATTTTKGPSRTDDRHTIGLLLPKSAFIEGSSACAIC